MGSVGTSQDHVLIVGAGITGLLIAQGLKKHNIPFTVFEKEPSASHYRPREWGLSVHWALPLLRDCLTEEMFARIHTAAVDPHYQPENPGRMPTLHGETGELIKVLPLPFMYRMSRRRFRTFVGEGIDIQYGKELAEVTYSDTKATVLLSFKDGSTYTGTTLIGADGAQSNVRTSIFGAEKARAQKVPYSAVNIHVRYDDKEKAEFVRQLHPIMAHAIHPKGYWLFIAVQDVPDPDDPSTWTFQLQTTWHKQEGEDAGSLENHKKRAATFGEPFRSANLWLPDDTPVSVNNISYWQPVPWDTKGGRILLVGDAAHPMTFQRGQGMNHGIGDASMIVKELKSAIVDKNKTLQQAVETYQTEMIDRAGAEVTLSLSNTEMLHDWTRFAQSAIMQQSADPSKNNKLVAQAAK